MFLGEFIREFEIYNIFTANKVNMTEARKFKSSIETELSKPVFKNLMGSEMNSQKPDEGQKDMKYDGGKLLGGVIFQDFPKAFQEVLGVATFGANKYARSSWKNVSNAETRYFDALCRHLLAYAGGEFIDEESKKAHLAHAAWNCLAVLELSKDKNEHRT